ncbi:unnamed protein product [Microthlaspi erraticum]|uniref:Uncharacterized protein n=1 Tax=Microthlaspi erraticum TaxID=1685480 RepID=A0A6D2ISE5_9BRAS|nr:unnamed protein product [Microthlaspi erraticum]
MDLHCAAQKILRCLCLEVSLRQTTGAQSTRINHPPTSANNRFTPNRPRSLTESREGLDTFSDFACGIELSRDRVASRDRRRMRGLVVRYKVLQPKESGSETHQGTHSPSVDTSGQSISTPEDYSAYVSVFIALASDGTDVRALFELLLFDHSGKGKHKVHSHFEFMVIFNPQRNTIYARVDSALRRIRETSEAVQNFASDYLKTPLGEPVKDKKNKTKTELWVETFYKKTTTLPEPFPHELVERLEKYLDTVEEQLVDLSSLLYDHKLYVAHLNSSAILQTTMYVEHVLETERENMRCCKIEYKYTVRVKSYQTLVYGGILVAGFLVYFLVTFFSSPPAR